MKRLGAVILVALTACGPEEPSSTATSLRGTYQGRYSLTQTSDLPPSEGQVSERASWSITVAPVGEDGVYTVLVDPTCSFRADETGAARASFLLQSGCRSLVLLPGSMITARAGTLALENGQLTVRLELRYESMDGRDRGTALWNFTGARR